MVVAFYFVVSISVVFVNKIIFSGEFNFPLAVTWYQYVVALVILGILGSLSSVSDSFAMFAPLQFDVEIARKVLPLSVVFVLMVALNNLCLQYVEVSFYQVARSLSILFNVLLGYVVLNSTVSMRALGATGIVFLGFVLGSYGEINFSLIGIIFGVLSSVFVALYGIMVKKTIAILDNDQWLLLLYNTELAIILMLPLILLSGEFFGILDTGLVVMQTLDFWFMNTFAGALGFLINIAMFLQIKFTSPLTNSISGTAKACVQTILGVLIFQNPISIMVRTALALLLLLIIIITIHCCQNQLVLILTPLKYRTPLAHSWYFLAPSSTPGYDTRRCRRNEMIMIFGPPVNTPSCIAQNGSTSSIQWGDGGECKLIHQGLFRIRTINQGGNALGSSIVKFWGRTSKP